MAFKFPDELELLDLYLRQKGLDPNSFDNERNALHVLMKETGIKRRFPERGTSALPAFRSIHSELFPYVELITKNEGSIVEGKPR